jgi:S-formylglutathione hydrolase
MYGVRGFAACSTAAGSFLVEILEEHRCFDGRLIYVSHAAQTTACPMRFSIYIPDVAEIEKRPVLWFLSGLTCTEDNFTVKAGAYRSASERGMIVVAPDTSPRGNDVPDDAAYDLGQGAGFYLNATQTPWAEHFQMYSYVTAELQQLVTNEFPADAARQGITGHSMGGHGALTIGLKNPSVYASISAFAPIVAPMQCPWGEKAFSAYLGGDRSSWAEYDATELVRAAGDRADAAEILIDVGLADPFLVEQLKPELLQQACLEVNQALNLREHEGHDHSYFFISSFVAEHVNHHADLLGA